MSEIPRITKTEKLSENTFNERYHQIAEEQKKVIPRKISNSHQRKTETNKLDVAFSISSSNYPKAQTFMEQNIVILQSTHAELELITDLLLQLLEMVKRTETLDPLSTLTKNIESNMLRLLEEIDYLASNIFKHGEMILEGTEGKMITLFFPPRGEIEVFFQIYHVTTEKLGIRYFTENLKESGNRERLITEIEQSLKKMDQYQEELVDIFNKIGVQPNEEQSLIHPDRAREMSELTKLLILSEYGINFFSQLTKQVKEFAQSPYGIILILGLMILLMVLLI